MSGMQFFQVDDSPSKGPDDIHVFAREYAATLDGQDPLQNLRKEFLIPSKADLRSTSLRQAGQYLLGD